MWRYQIVKEVLWRGDAEELEVFLPPYAMPGTPVGYAATLIVWYCYMRCPVLMNAMPGTGVGYAHSNTRSVLRVRDALCGTDLGYVHCIPPTI